ncbi:MAG: phosphodiester glycosidase family protein [Oscillospiraceae bacterium]
MKKYTILSFFLAITLILSTVSSAYASGIESTGHADALHSLGLFQGSDTGYDLEKSPTRAQGVVMLIRLLGEENAARECTAQHPFNDVPEWASQYVSYAVLKNYTKGTGTATFSPNAPLDAKSYVTFILRALEYDDSKGDFSWSTALSDCVKIGLMASGTATALSSAALNRGDLVDLSYSTLTMSLKGKAESLAQKLVSANVFTAEQGKAAGILAGPLPYTYVPVIPPVPADNSTVDYARKAVSLASGRVTADIITVNLNNPRVSVKAALVNNTIGATAPFSQIVSQSGAVAAINSNFFQAYDAFKVPIGHLVCNGQFMNGSTGLPSFGFTSDNKVTVGNPAFFFRVAVSGSATKSWPCYELNSVHQASFNSIVYTPAYGTNLKITCDGTIVIVENGTVAKLAPCHNGETLVIPQNGYIMWLGSEYTSTNYYHAPQIGDKVEFTPYLYKDDPEGFSYNNVVSVVSGAPRLVKKGVIETYLDPGFTEARFTTSSTPRTAIGTLPNGKLVLVSVGAATIQQMRELMLSLGCTDALNLDGGGSTAMFCSGKYIRNPGRALTSTLQVFVS